MDFQCRFTPRPRPECSDIVCDRTCAQTGDLVGAVCGTDIEQRIVAIVDVIDAVQRCCVIVGGDDDVIIVVVVVVYNCECFAGDDVVARTAARHRCECARQQRRR
jgi:hypothetical protein